MKHVFVFLTLFSAVFGIDSKYISEDCPRIRRPYNALTDEERLLYVNGFQELRRNGKLDIISQTHAANSNVHKGASFFPFHSYLIWEAETQIRALGSEYSCFSMPYWDYTEDSGYENDPPIFHLSVGGNGNPRNDFCVNDPDNLWNVNEYWSTLEDSCFNDETKPYCCLKRQISSTQLLPSSIELGSVFIRNSNYLLFETQIDHYHVAPHFYLAIKPYCQIATAYAPDDPLFFLLHTFTLYQRALWTTCYNYDQIDVNELQKYNDAYTPSCNPGMDDCGIVGLDATYKLYPMSDNDWSLASSMDITPRIMFNINDWNIQYDLGTFYSRSKLDSWCKAKSNIGEPNKDWFTQVTDVESFQNNELQDFIDNTYNRLHNIVKRNDLDVTEDEIYFAVESLTCKYHRDNSPNSCFSEIDQDMEYETCETRGIYASDDVNLDDMLDFDGVKDNECLKTRRKEIYATSNLYDSIKLNLCNGEYDYKCTEWKHDTFDLNQILSLENNINWLHINITSIYVWYVFAGFVIIIMMMQFVITKISNYNKNRKLANYNDKRPADVEYGTF